MHEFSIAQSLIQLVLAEAEKAHARKVLKVSLNFGELTGVVSDSLSFCFDLLSKSTIAENAKITIEKVPIRGYCSPCKVNFVITHNPTECPLAVYPSRSGRGLHGLLRRNLRRLL